MSDDLEEYSSADFEPKERQELRRNMQARRHRVWILSVLKRISLWVIAVAGAVSLAAEFLRSILLGKGP